MAPARVAERTGNAETRGAVVAPAAKPAPVNAAPPATRGDRAPTLIPSRGEMVPASEAQQRQILEDPMVKRVMELFEGVPVNIERRMETQPPGESPVTDDGDDENTES